MGEHLRKIAVERLEKIHNLEENLEEQLADFDELKKLSNDKGILLEKFAEDSESEISSPEATISQLKCELSGAQHSEEHLRKIAVERLEKIHNLEEQLEEQLADFDELKKLSNDKGLLLEKFAEDSESEISSLEATISQLKCELSGVQHSEEHLRKIAVERHEKIHNLEEQLEEQLA